LNEITDSFVGKITNYAYEKLLKYFEFDEGPIILLAEILKKKYSE
jgi:hypothetical protein